MSGSPRIGIRGRRPAIFLDYDGTLTPIVDRPQLAVLSEPMRDVLARLSRACPVVIVSGRDREDVARLVGLDHLVYAGSHGFDISGPSGLRREHPEARAYLGALDDAASSLGVLLAGVEGALVERKRFAIAVHYRLVASTEISKVDADDDAEVRAHSSLRRPGGKMVFELRPRVSWDKGKAVLWLLEALDLGGPDIEPFYIGDDETDEDAFRAVRGRGVGIRVGEDLRPTEATFMLHDPDAVRTFLSGLLEGLAPEGAR
jgi:trehalose-phosphatase